MRWFRLRRRRWSWVALLALALQLALSFGHLHVHAHHPALIAASDAPASAATQPPDSDDDHESHYCAIYAINALLSGGQIASAPVVLALVAPDSAGITIVPEAAPIVASRAAFNSRAPPHS
jgi:hypothetical protein